MDENRLSNEEDGLSIILEGLSRRNFLTIVGATGALAVTAVACRKAGEAEKSAGAPAAGEGVAIPEVKQKEDVFAYISRVKGGFDQTLYQQVIGAANAFKEGDLAIGVGAKDDASRQNARTASDKHEDQGSLRTPPVCGRPAEVGLEHHGSSPI